ncbi:Fc.00g108990.m01.CDS01 [Cosmosporella sp. VM-42]
MSGKAAQYINQLDHARCEGNWDVVPELVRKVRKHAPNRSCLALTAETECAISRTTSAAAAAAGLGRPGTARPTTAATTREIDVASQIPRLVASIEEETSHQDDRFQAQVCAGWLHWVLGEYSLCAERLPKNLRQEESDVNPADRSSEWTNVCALKAAYLKANCFARESKKGEALVAFESGLPSLGRVWSGQALGKQLRYWSELFLTEYCMLSSQALHEGDASLQDPNAIACFRSWARFWDVLSAPITGGFGFKGSVPRRRIWNEYYLALSQILEDDLPFPSGLVGGVASDLSSRGQLRVELKQAEAAYQALLLGETSFPRADEEREEVESFVRLVVKNWSILCGRGWREQDLGQGGRSSLSRGVLDTLYASATRTYHSTAILRFLFIVHLSVAEFELAFKAFDSYLEIVKKGKARVDKTGHLEAGLDDDATVLETMAQCIVALCRYGHRSAAEKALQLGSELEDWLAKLPQVNTPENGTPMISEVDESTMSHPPIPGQVVALAWQAIGLSYAHWSRVTYEAASRTEIQAKAIRCLRRSLATEFGHSKDIRSFFALSLLLAERRELTAAIEVVKTALQATKGQEDHYSLFYGSYWQERSLIPVWHLLALLLSARQDYVMAARACEGALEQFKDPSVLFGKADQNFRSEHLNEAEAKTAEAEAKMGLVDDMDDSEKESILEVKMTQLALVELMEGPDVAVNASFELLTLFSRLFGNVTAQPVLNLPKATEPPKTSGTLRSIKGSIFGSKDRSRPPTRQFNNLMVNDRSSIMQSRPATAQTMRSTAPTIQITGDNNSMAEISRPRTSAGSVNRSRSASGRSNSLKKRDRSASRQRSSSVSTRPHQPTVLDGDFYFTPGTDSEGADFFTYSSKRQPASRASSFSRGRQLSHLNSYLSTNSKSTDFSELSVDATYASTNLLPLIQFPKDKERIQRVTILIRVWLMIAGFYRRAGMNEDSKGAITEAQRLIQSLESESTRDPTGSGSLRGAGWAEKKSVEDLWGDLWSEVRTPISLKNGVETIAKCDVTIQMGLLSLCRSAPYTARADFESALTHAPNHPAAIVGLSNILLDIYCEDLLPPPTIPPLDGILPSYTQNNSSTKAKSDNINYLPSTPLGLGSAKPNSKPAVNHTSNSNTDEDQLPQPYKATCLPLVDRLAARDRAYALLSTLTKLGSAWNMSEAWFALARAHEESGQSDKAKEVLWWCVELEEGTGVRDWRSLSGGGYII